MVSTAVGSTGRAMNSISLADMNSPSSYLPYPQQDTMNCAWPYRATRNTAVCVRFTGATTKITCQLPAFPSTCDWQALNVTSLRTNEMKLRRIMVSADMDPNKTYYIRFKNVLNNKDLQFFMDYFEFVSKEVYDNPVEPEDYW